MNNQFGKDLTHQNNSFITNNASAFSRRNFGSITTPSYTTNKIEIQKKEEKIQVNLFSFFICLYFFFF